MSRAVVRQARQAVAKLQQQLDQLREMLDGNLTPERTKSGNPRIWSPERVKLLREKYSAGDGFEEILPALNKLPGSPLTLHSVRNAIGRYDIRRSPATIAQRKQEAARRLHQARKAGTVPQSQPLVWSDERLAKLRQLYPQPGAVEDIAAQLSALPGAAVTVKHVRKKAGELQLKRLHPTRNSPPPPRRRKAEPTPGSFHSFPRSAFMADPKAGAVPPPLDAQPLTPAEVDAKREAKLQQARELLRSTKKPDAFAIAKQLRLLPREVLQLQGELRAERQAVPA